MKQKRIFLMLRNNLRTLDMLFCNITCIQKHVLKNKKHSEAEKPISQNHLILLFLKYYDTLMMIIDILSYLS